jgi:predicted transcriptional regulator
VISDSGVRARLRAGALRVRARLGTWDDSAARLAAALATLTEAGLPGPEASRGDV